MKKVLLYYINFAVLICSVNYLHAQDNRGYIVNVGDQAPDFIIDGKNIIQENKGKVIMLQFTASWCSVCIREMPHIEEEIWQMHKENDNFILIGLAKDTDKRPQKKQEIDLMINKTGVTYPIVTDKKSMVFNLFAEQKAGVTRNIIIDQNGKIQFLTRLFEIEEFNQMKLKIKDLLK
tara:strand:- start:129 stop:659 length:531 start_codon:yes stop_codon:yes gene_type:complete